MNRYGASDSLEAEEAGGIALGHHVDLGLAEALFCEDRQSDLKGIGVGHPAGLAEIGGHHDVLRTERSNIRKLLWPVIIHWIVGVYHVGSSTREAVPAQHDLDQRAQTDRLLHLRH